MHIHDLICNYVFQITYKLPQDAFDQCKREKTGKRIAALVSQMNQLQQVGKEFVNFLLVGSIQVAQRFARCSGEIEALST